MIQETQASFRRLETTEWVRWGVAMTVAALMTSGVFFLSLPGLQRNFAEQAQLQIAVSGLIGMLLLFIVFSVYQQIRIVRLRRELAAQLAMVATLEVLKPPPPGEFSGETHNRQAERYYLDERIKIIVQRKGKQVAILGRTSDISDGGMGAVISETLTRGTDVNLEFQVPGEISMRLQAIVRHQRGFHHGFEFFGVTAEQAALIRRACAAGVPLSA